MKIREIIQTLFPTKTWKLAAIIAGGVLCGLGSYTLYASRAWTYLSDDPATCVNCHCARHYELSLSLNLNSLQRFVS